MSEVYYQDEYVTLIHGDCLDVLAELPDASVDAVVTDPPYGLEFMGNEWDAPWADSDVNADAGFRGGGLNQTKGLPSFTGSTNPKCLTCKGTRRGRRDGTAKVAVCLCPDGGRFPNTRAVEMRAFQDWCAAWVAECLRVLKPGGHILAFGGSRTWHRLACAVEDAGFEIRDSIAWLYGCLTADADVLTDRGWVNGLDVQEGDLVAQWDHATGRVELASVEQTFRAPWDGPMRVLRSSDTDQVLTPNHRVYHQTYEREQVAGARTGSWSGWTVAEAGDLSTWQAVRLPVAGTHDGPGIGGEDYAALLGWVWTEGGFDQSGTGVRIYQSSVNPEKCDEIAALLDRMGPYKRYDYARTYTRRNGQTHRYTATTWFFTGDLASRVRADLPGKRPTYDLLWRMTADEKRAMLRAAMLGDGSGWGGTSPQFYQKHEDDLVWLQTLLALIDQSGKVTMRGDRPGGQLSLRQRGTTDLQARHLRNSTERYTGEVWCVKVPSGAFVARRNGRVFITGNSGFPKSLNVAKAIERSYPCEDSGMWDGWGTALKTSFEPIVVARKPLAGTVASTVLAHGTGALNIDACRTATSEADHECDSAHGRWPTNVILDDTTAADLDEQTGVSRSRVGKPRAGAAGDGWGMTATGTEYDDEGGASRFFPVMHYAAKAPTAERPEVDGVQHPTVKPLALMQWLVRLVARPGALVLEPFAGSGTTLEACIAEGMRCVGIEREAKYLPLIQQRLSKGIDIALDLGGIA